MLLRAPDDGLKAFIPIVSTEFPIVTVLNLVYSKAQEPILVTELGMVISFRFVHLENAKDPILFKEFGRTMFFKAEQSENILSIDNQ